MKHLNLKSMLGVLSLLCVALPIQADDVVTTEQPTDATQTKVTLKANFLEGADKNGFQYKYGTIPERTEFVNLAIAPTGDPLVFKQGTKAWNGRKSAGWVESYYDTSASTLTSEVSTTFNLTSFTWISFEWQVSSEEGIGKLHFVVDGTIVQTITGETEFETVTYDLSAGEHTLAWRYVRTAAENAGLGLGRLKNLNVQNTTEGTWIDVPAEGNSVQLTGLYPSQEYLFRAYSAKKTGMVSNPGGPVYKYTYSDIKQFGTKGVSFSTPKVDATTQSTATVSCNVFPGDAEVETGIIIDRRRPKLSDSFAEALLSPYSDGVTVTHHSYWKAGDGYVYFNSKYDGYTMSTTFSLTKSTTISFDYTVSN